MVANKSEISLPHGDALRRAELFDRSAIARSQSDRPPVLVRVERMRSILRCHLLRVYSAVLYHLSQALGIADAIPGIECLVQVGSHRENRLPKRAICRLKHIRAPGRYRQLSTWTNETPQFSHCARHVGNKEDSENTYDSVEALAWI